tara:strand:- start:136 stop:282 length:147 start_codon:yes stop_codon:yes gene_type:complete
MPLGVPTHEIDCDLARKYSVIASPGYICPPVPAATTMVLNLFIIMLAS